MDHEQAWNDAVTAAAVSASLRDLVDALNNRADLPTIVDWRTEVYGEAMVLYEMMTTDDPHLRPGPVRRLAAN